MLRQPYAQAPCRGHGSRALAAVVLTALALGVVGRRVAASRVASPVRVRSGFEAATTKLRGDSSARRRDAAVDPRLPGSCPATNPASWRRFAVLTQPLDAAHRAALTATGARIPRSYRTVDMVAIAARPSTIRAVAGLSWVAWLAPVDVIVALGAQAAPIPTSGTGSWQVKLPGATRVNAAGDAIATFTATIPSSAPAGTYSGVVIATTDHGRDHQDPGLRQRRPPRHVHGGRQRTRSPGPHRVRSGRVRQGRHVVAFGRWGRREPAPTPTGWSIQSTWPPASRVRASASGTPTVATRRTTCTSTTPHST